MRIKRVEIIGFKSFCDRAVVQIGEQITGVVGPNGCGKSNIVDAIRWCMGEQSAKHLRGKAMEDVIFAGSESRGPAPMAEVSLTFDDVGFSHETLELGRQTQQDERELAALAGDIEEGPEIVDSSDGPDGPDGEAEDIEVAAEAPETTGTWLDKEGNKIASPVEEVQELLEDKPPAFEFSHYTEVTITRRLYRDGISQYFINKSPCRLRDITDFFLGTGVGTKAYAIIEQGRIGQIVSARPQDRRAIIEEAAGITKFKSKKKAAERKLDQTRQNLMRVSDIVTELDKRMGTLRRQAQKAERYRKYKSEMKDIELWKASHRWLELAGEHALVSGRLGDVRTELETVRTTWAVKDATVIAERAELSLEERRLVGVQEKVYELDNKIRLGDSKIGFELREADELDVRVAHARTEIDEVIGQRERGAIELAERRGQLDALEADVERETGEVRAREAAAGEARQMLANAEGRLDETRGQLAERKTQIATAQAQLQSLAHRRGETSGRLDRVNVETEQHAKGAKDLEREHRRVDNALAELRQTRLDLGSQGEDFAVRREQLSTEVSRGEAEVETLRTELHRRRSRLQSLEEIQERYEGFARGTRAVMQGASAFTDRVSSQGEAIRGVVADVVRAPELLEVAVEAALGDRLGGVLVADAQVGAAAIGYLKKEGGGRSAFVPMSAHAGLDSAGVPEPVRDDHFGEARFESAATRVASVGVPQPFEGEGNSGRGDLSEAHRVGVAHGSGAIVETADAEPSPTTMLDHAGPDLRLAIAAELRARSLLAGMKADAELCASGVALRARSLFCDAELASEIAGPLVGESLVGTSLVGISLVEDEVVFQAPSANRAKRNAAFGVAVQQAEAFGGGTFSGAALVGASLDDEWTQGADELDAAMRAELQLASEGAALRARSLFADALLADPLLAGILADAELVASGTVARMRSLAAEGALADGSESSASESSSGEALASESFSTEHWGESVSSEFESEHAGEPVSSEHSDSEPSDRDAEPAWAAGLRADGELQHRGAALRTASLRSDAALALALLEEQALVRRLTEMFLVELGAAESPLASAVREAATMHVETAPTVAYPVSPAAEARRPAFEFEDRSHLIDAMVANRKADDVVGEGVLGRMIDLVGFTDGYEAVGKRLLGRTVVVDSLERAIGLYERGVGDRLVTLDGDIVDQDGVVAGGSREAQGAGVLAQKREIRELHDLVGRLEHELSGAMQRLITAKTELAQVTKAIDGLRKQVHEGEVAIVGHEKDDARVRGELERHRDRLGQLAKEQLELEERLAAITHDEGGHRERLERATTEQRDLEQLQLDLIAALGGHRERLEELGHALTEVRVRAAQLEAQRSAVEAATLRLAQTDAELSARVDRLRAECEESARRSTTLREGCEQLAAELALTREERGTESRTLEEGRTAYQARLEALSEIELETRELRTRGDQLAKELGELELRHGQIGMTRKVVEEQVSERYQMDIEDVLPEYHQRGLVSEAEDNRLTELRELIDRMGTDINLTAIDEFADVSARFEFLSAQKIDLERAVDQLQKAIDKINKTSRKLFKDTFAAVNATFKEVFPRLFRGGHAALSLSSGEESDLLEAGIEIFAQPPGKKNVTVDQLSGGEKALTAVALVFSIFLIKPSPFCILDEVDAPLDEANVDRYNEIVREMTDRSQFIVITHNKRTMEAADNLYGVTMQEPGVSKLVNVNLSKLSPSDRPPASQKSITNVVVS
jgi:chromosome segregation ATPase